MFASTSVLDIKGFDEKNPYAIAGDQDLVTVAAEEETEYQTIPQMEKAISKIKKEMEKAAQGPGFYGSSPVEGQHVCPSKEINGIEKLRRFMKKKLFLLDAMALIFRAYYALIRAPRSVRKGRIQMPNLGLPIHWLS